MTDEEKILALKQLFGTGAQINQINFGNGTQNFYANDRQPHAEAPIDADIVTEQDKSSCNCLNEEQLCSLIHPSVTDREEQLKIHSEIKNLVTHYQAQDICSYLKKMADADKIFLPQSMESAMKELQRMGMPDESTEGFAKKTLYKYYRK